MHSRSPGVTFENVASNTEMRALIAAADRRLAALGLNEHGFRHAGIVAERSARTLQALDFDPDSQELAKIAGFLHDIGNAISRRNHAATGVLLAHGLLSRLEMTPERIAVVIGAIGSHGDDLGEPGVAIDAVSAALILADKSDVQRSRVRGRDIMIPDGFDLHDRMGFAAVSSSLVVDPGSMSVSMNVVLDSTIATEAEFVDVFRSGFSMCGQAAAVIGCTFSIDFAQVAIDRP